MSKPTPRQQDISSMDLTRDIESTIADEANEVFSELNTLKVLNKERKSQSERSIDPEWMRKASTEVERLAEVMPAKIEAFDRRFRAELQARERHRVATIEAITQADEMAARSKVVAAELETRMNLIRKSTEDQLQLARDYFDQHIDVVNVDYPKLLQRVNMAKNEIDEDGQLMRGNIKELRAAWKRSRKELNDELSYLLDVAWELQSRQLANSAQSGQDDQHSMTNVTQAPQQTTSTLKSVRGTGRVHSRRALSTIMEIDSSRSSNQSSVRTVEDLQQSATIIAQPIYPRSSKKAHGLIIKSRIRRGWQFFRKHALNSKV